MVTFDPKKAPTLLLDAIIQEVAFEAGSKQIYPIAQDIIYTLNTPKFGIAVLAFQRLDGTIPYFGFTLSLIPKEARGVDGQYAIFFGRIQSKR